MTLEEAAEFFSKFINRSPGQLIFLPPTKHQLDQACQKAFQNGQSADDINAAKAAFDSSRGDLL